MTRISVSKTVSWEGREMYIAYVSGIVEVGLGWTAEVAINAAIKYRRSRDLDY